MACKTVVALLYAVCIEDVDDRSLLAANGQIIGAQRGAARSLAPPSRRGGRIQTALRKRA